MVRPGCSSTVGDTEALGRALTRSPRETRAWPAAWGAAAREHVARHSDSSGSWPKRPPCMRRWADDMAADDRRARARRRPRVLRIITRLAVGGVSTHVTLANQGLTRRGWDTLLIHGRVQPDELEIDLPDPGRRHAPDRDAGTTDRPGRRPADCGQTAQRRPIIPARTSSTRITPRPDSSGARWGCSPASPRVHTFHGHVFEGYFGRRTSTAIVMAERLLATRTSRLIALGPLQRDDLLSRGIGRPDRFEIVPLGPRPGAISIAGSGSGSRPTRAAA